MCRMLCCALCPLSLLQPSCPCPCLLTQISETEFVNFFVPTGDFLAGCDFDVAWRFFGTFFAPSSPTFRRQLTIIQANPLNHKQPDIHLMTGSRGMLAAKEALVVPMLLRLSHFRLCSYVVLVVSKQKGITLVFKTDPLQNVDINSTFDSIAVIQSFIQREIEGLLRQMFREDLPGIIHRLSQQWVKAKVETPYLSKPPAPLPVSLTMSAPDLRTLPHLPSTRQASVAYSMAPGLRPYYPRARTTSSPSIAGTTRSRTHRSESPTSVQSPDPPDSTFPEIENFDPTYGLRPEGLPNKSVFRSFGRLFANPSRGLADLAEESTDEDEDVVGSEGASYDLVDWEDTVPGLTPEASVLGDHPAGPSSGLEYESVPAVGGGTVTRPRVFHAHSQVHLRPPRPSSLLSSTSRLTHAALEQLPRADLPHRPHSLYNPFLPHFADSDAPPRAPSMRAYSHLRDPSEAPTPPLYHSPPRRPISPSSIHTHESSSHTHTHSVPTPPSTDVLTSTYAPAHRLTRRASITSTSAGPDTDARIVLRPALHGALSTLATLAHSNHTLSPYTRALSHFTVRSAPRRAPPAPPRAPPRARRRRTHVLGAAAAAKAQEAETAARDSGDEGEEGDGQSVEPPSEFDAEDMDRYFRTRDELASVAVSEPGPAYGLQPGLYGRARVSVRHARPPESLDAYPNSRQRHKYVYRG
jgi:distribution and morphology protein 34